MNDLGQLLCVLVSLTGGVYCLAILRDCRTRDASQQRPTGSLRGRAHRKKVCARINRICQVLLATTFLAVAGTLLAGFACRAFSLLSDDGAAGRQPPPATETVAIPGYPPVIARYDSARADRPVVWIDCAGKPISDDQLRGLLRERQGLRELNLADTGITDDALREIRRAPQLQTLTLAGTQVGDAGLQHLAELRNLEVLYLDDTKTADEGLRCLAGLKNLRELSLRNTAVTDAGLKWLGRLDNLESLELEGTRVTRQGVECLKNTLPRVSIDR